MKTAGSHAGYLTALFDRKTQNSVVKNIKLLIKEKDLKFDGFVVTGISGVSMGAIMSRLLNKKLMVVRKDEDDDNHSWYNIENYTNGGKYIFLDDLIASGNTLKRVKECIQKEHTKKLKYNPTLEAPEIIGVLLYAGRMISNTPKYYPGCSHTKKYS